MPSIYGKKPPLCGEPLKIAYSKKASSRRTASSSKMVWGRASFLQIVVLKNA
jgi:hypothetical protein